jgi:hypothetical protein
MYISIDKLCNRLSKWKKDLKNSENVNGSVNIPNRFNGKVPVYGKDIDLELFNLVKEKMFIERSNVACNDMILRELLLSLLQSHGKMNLLLGNGGSCVFQRSWALRFWKRYDNQLQEVKKQIENELTLHDCMLNHHPYHIATSADDDNYTSHPQNDCSGMIYNTANYTSHPQNDCSGMIYNTAVTSCSNYINAGLMSGGDNMHFIGNMNSSNCDMMYNSSVLNSSDNETTIDFCLFDGNNTIGSSVNIGRGNGDGTYIVGSINADASMTVSDNIFAGYMNMSTGNISADSMKMNMIADSMEMSTSNINNFAGNMVGENWVSGDMNIDMNNNVNFDDIMSNNDNDNDDNNKSAKNKKAWSRRPENWEEIGEYFEQNDLPCTVDRYPHIFKHLPYENIYQKLQLWRKDMMMQRTIKPLGRVPEYGKDIDELLLNLVKEKLSRRERVSDMKLRSMLVDLLKQKDRQYLLRENGGENTYGSAWVNRFWKRWKLPVRDVKSKNKNNIKDDDADEHEDNNNNEKEHVNSVCAEGSCQDRTTNELSPLQSSSPSSPTDGTYVSQQKVSTTFDY